MSKGFEVKGKRKRRRGRTTQRDLTVWTESQGRSRALQPLIGGEGPHPVTGHALCFGSKNNNIITIIKTIITRGSDAFG